MPEATVADTTTTTEGSTQTQDTRPTTDQLIDRAVAAYEAEQQSQAPAAGAADDVSHVRDQAGLASGQAAPESGSAAPAAGYDPFGNVLQYLQEHADPRLAGKYKTGADVLAGFINAQQLLGQRDEDARLGRWINENPEQALQRLQERYGRQPQPAPSAQPSAPQSAPAQSSSAPQFDPSWIGQYTVNGNGDFVDLPGAIPGTAAKVRDYYLNYIQDQRAMLQDPLRNPKVRDTIAQNYVSREEFSNLLQGLQSDRAQQEAYATLNRLSPKLFNQNQAGLPDPNAGRTHWGNLFTLKLQEAEQMGIGRTPEGFTNHALQNAYAEREADLLYHYGMLAAYARQAQNGEGQPTYAQAAPPTSAVRTQNNGSAVPLSAAPPVDASGRRDLGAMLNSALANALATGQVTQHEFDRWQNSGAA